MRFTNSKASRRSVPPLLYVDAHQIKKAIQCFDDPAYVVIVVQNMVTVTLQMSRDHLCKGSSAALPIGKKLLGCQGSMGLLCVGSVHAFADDVGDSFTVQGLRARIYEHASGGDDSSWRWNAFVTIASHLDLFGVDEVLR